MMTYTFTKTKLEPGKLYKVSEKRSIPGHSITSSLKWPKEAWALHNINPGTIMLAVGEKGYPKWADRSDGCWVLIGESKVWVEEHHFRHLEVIDV